jgi:hypothetical protein
MKRLLAFEKQALTDKLFKHTCMNTGEVKIVIPHLILVATNTRIAGTAEDRLLTIFSNKS